MCTRFVYNGKETIVGFNFDIDLSEWEHTVITEKDHFFIGIKCPIISTTLFTESIEMGMLAHCCMYMEMTMHNFAVMNHAIQ